MNSYAIPGLVLTAAYFVILVIMMRVESDRRADRVFAILIINVIIWSLSESLRKLVMPPEKGWADFWYYPYAAFFAKVMNVAAALMLATFYHLSTVFPRGKGLQTGGWGVYIFTAIWGVVMVSRPEFSPGLKYSFEGYGIKYGYLMIPSVILILVFALWALSNFYRSYKKLKSTLIRSQLRIIIVGSLLMTVGGILTIVLNMVDPLIMHGIPESTYLMPLLIAISIAILKYRMFDMDVLVREGIISFLTALVIAAVCVGMLWGVFTLTTGAMSLEKAIFLMVVITCILLVYSVVRTGVTRFVEFALPNLKWKECKLEEVYLVATSGVLLAHKKRRGVTQSMDRDIIGGMLTAIQDFVAQSFRVEDRETLKSLRVGNTKMVIEHSPQAYLAVVFTGNESKELRSAVRGVLDIFVKRNAKILSEWDGKLSRLRGAQELVNNLFPADTQHRATKGV